MKQASFLDIDVEKFEYGGNLLNDTTKRSCELDGNERQNLCFGDVLVMMRKDLCIFGRRKLQQKKRKPNNN